MKGLGYGCPCAVKPGGKNAVCVTVPLYRKGKRSRVYDVVCRTAGGTVSSHRVIGGRKSRTKVSARHRRAVAKAMRSGRLGTKTRARRLRG